MEKGTQNFSRQMCGINSLGNHVSSWNLGPKHDSLGPNGPKFCNETFQDFWGNLVESFSPQGGCKALSSKGNLFEEIAQKLHPFFILLWEKMRCFFFF
jgi:hypothetical protein